MWKLLRNLMKSPMFVIGVGIFFLSLFVAILGPVFYNVDINARDIVAGPYAPSSSEHLLGTDHLGRDYVSLLISGLRSSLYVGLIAGVIATTIGVFIGLFGGFRGGWIDEILNMGTNLFIVIPQFVILVLISSAVKEGRSLTLIGLIIGLTSWSWSARAVRAQASSLRSRDHISLARINGASSLTIVVKHVLPYLLSYVFMVFIMQVSSGILSEASISMIGLGPLDSTSLGIILNQAKDNGALSDSIWIAFLPATLVITLTVFALYLINTSMEGVFNPRLRK
ncbi:peptide/nickel transport system permease protein [Fibrobacter intestinalis]|uniref:Peptide/nickel transport system permease protein n=3 Tax=Fibrobacteraceae TaxID=204431 RepID=A0A1M6XFP1_9BACT|nr:ABC transporter permease [Fibrobacter intestinalis]PBC69372.1 peptide/nickel transport system permease protein [Fibrobacter sp. UWS1]PBC74578.1 peptide/nickel transport system permease protein [Fibrobacter sp. NR9]SHL04723.1 peptide/nickel transport system permease protein [Fibrobacter intestinalis]SKA07406.1 peptide/nickel transport system permease protein [Fibrobacter intestinalis]